MSNPNQNPQTNSVVTEVVFDETVRHEAFLNDLQALPKGQRGFLGAQYLGDLPTGGIRKDGQDKPVKPPKPENPFEQ